MSDEGDDVRDDEADPNDGAALARKWRRRVRIAEKYFEQNYFPTAKKTVDRYRDDRANADSPLNRTRRFNLFWSNVQTLQPAVNSRVPVPVVSRRYADKDPIARVASSVIERAITYDMDTGNFKPVMLLARDDYLIVGRGVLWQRYEPKFEEVPAEPLAPGGVPAEPDMAPPMELPDEPAAEADPLMSLANELTPEPAPIQEKLVGETAPTDYVYWKDFVHDPAPTWLEVNWVSRRVLMSKEKCKKRFGDKAKKLKYTHRRQQEEDEGSKKRSDDVDLALIWEVWDKETKRAIWVSPDVHDDVLDVQDDPLRLKDFFPCPPPLYATTTSNTLIPRPDYVLYRDQAREIDILTERISLLVSALAVRGAYDSSNPSLANLVTERPENHLIPVNNWAAFAEKGGLKGQVSFLPLDQIIQVVEKLIAQRTQLIQDVYQITGIADIVRGSTKPNETLGAQRIKANFATLRLDDRRDAVSGFLRDAIGLRAEVICEHFQPETIRKMSGFDQLTDVIELQKKEDGPQLVEALWEKVIELIKNDELRLFRLEIETNSTIEIDKQEEQAKRVELVTALGGYLEKAVLAAQAAPMLIPLLGHLLSFFVRSFQPGRELEAALDAAIEEMTNAAQSAPPSGGAVDPAAQAAAAAEEKKADHEMQLAERKAQSDEALAGKKFNLDQYREDKNHNLREQELLMKYGLHPAQRGQPMAPPAGNA